jgi:hypothetical protein
MMSRCKCVLLSCSILISEIKLRLHGIALSAALSAKGINSKHWWQPVHRLHQDAAVQEHAEMFTYSSKFEVHFLRHWYHCMHIRSMMQTSRHLRLAYIDPIRLVIALRRVGSG